MCAKQTVPPSVTGGKPCLESSPPTFALLPEEMSAVMRLRQRLKLCRGEPEGRWPHHGCLQHVYHGGLRRSLKPLLLEHQNLHPPGLWRLQSKCQGLGGVGCLEACHHSHATHGTAMRCSTVTRLPHPSCAWRHREEHLNVSHYIGHQHLLNMNLPGWCISHKAFK